jgi:hypothetical protein
MVSGETLPGEILTAGAGEDTAAGASGWREAGILEAPAEPPAGGSFFPSAEGKRATIFDFALS